MKVGYARVSTKEQNLDMQIQALTDTGCEKIFTEKTSGVSERPALKECMTFLRKDDVLIVYKIDRLARSLRDILFILDELKNREVRFISIKDSIDTTGVTGQLITHILASFAQFERDLIRERCQNGRKIAMQKGKKMGRPTGKVNKVNKKKIEQCAHLYKYGMTVKEIKETLNIGSYETIYRYLRKAGSVLRK